MVKTLLSNVKDNPNIEKYFSENRDLFVNVLNTTIEQTPALKGMGLKGELYDIVPALLKHPKELIEIIDAQKTGNYTEITQKFSELAKDPALKGTLAKAGVELTAKAVEATIGVKVTDDIGRIFGILMENNQAKGKVQEIVEAYQQGKWTNVAKETCRLLENPELKQYIENNTENLKQIVNKVVGELKKDPESVVSKYLAGADVGQIANTILQNPEPMRNLVQAYDDGNKTAMAQHGAKILATIAYNDPTSALNVTANVATQGARALYNWATGTGSQSAEAKEQQQAWVANILKDVVYAYRDTEAPLKLNDYLKKDLESELKANPNLMNSLLQNMTIGKSVDEKLKLENLVIEGNSFTNSKLENVSFKDTEFKNVDFTGASFKNVNLSEATIDAATFKSMLNEVKAGHISLNGAKIIGDLSGMDLSGLALNGADLSKVTGMQNVNLKDTNITDAKLPESKVLADTYNLDKAVVTSIAADNKPITQSAIAAGTIPQETIQAQQDKFIDKAVEQLSRVIEDRHEPVMTDAQKTALSTNIKGLIRDGGTVGEYIKKGLEATPEDVLNKKFPIDPKSITHVADYAGKTNNLMTILLENKTSDVETIKGVITANYIADNVTKELFKEGGNRGQDGLTIKQITQQAVTKFIQENPEAKTGLIKSLEEPGQKLMNSISETIINTAVEKTWAGTLRRDEDRIQLKTNIPIAEVANKVKSEMNYVCGSSKFNKQELDNIEAMASKIGTELFDAGYASNPGRVSDVKLIEQQLKDTFYQVKVENKVVDISEMIDQHMDKMVGTKLDRGTFSDTPGTGLAGIYSARDAAPYTAAGKVTGGIQLDHAVVATLETSIKTTIKDALQSSSLATQIPTPEIQGTTPEIQGTTPPQKQDISVVSQDLVKETPAIKIQPQIPIADPVQKQESVSQNIATEAPALRIKPELDGVEAIAKTIGIKLFGAGYTSNGGRVNDVKLIESGLEAIITKIEGENKEINISKVMTEKNAEQIIETLAEKLTTQYRDKGLQSTYAGWISGGKQLDQAKIASNEFKTSATEIVKTAVEPLLLAAQAQEIKNIPVSQDVATTTRQEQSIRSAPDPYPLNQKEHEGIETIAKIISTNLFKSEAEENGARFSDTKIIENALKNVIHQIKIENEGKDISEVMTPKNAQQIIKTLAKELEPEFRKSTEEIVDHKNRSTGDIQLDQDKIVTGDFKTKLQEKIRTLVDPILTTAKNLDVIQEAVKGITNPKIVPTEKRPAVTQKVNQGHGVG